RTRAIGPYHRCQMDHDSRPRLSVIRATASTRGWGWIRKTNPLDADLPSLAAPFSYRAAGEALGAALLDLDRFRLSRLREIYHRLLAGGGGVRGSGPDVGTVGQHFPLASIGPQLQVEHDAQLLAQLRVLDWRDDFDATFKIALHAIGGADEELLRAAIAEIKDAAVFEEPANNAHHAHVLRQSLDSRAQPAGVADYQLNLHARLRGAIKR